MISIEKERKIKVSGLNQLDESCIRTVKLFSKWLLLDVVEAGDEVY
jgi:hypothetical protein